MTVVITFHVSWRLQQGINLWIHVLSLFLYGIFAIHRDPDPHITPAELSLSGLPIDTGLLLWYHFATNST